MIENRKIVIRERGESFRACTAIVRETLGPPGPGQLLVRNHFAGVNGVYDQMMCLDRVEHTPVRLPADAGVEAVGVVEAAGAGVAASWVGQAVASVRVGHGYREYQLAAEADLVPVPAASPEILALIPSGVSALLALERVGEMGTGETVCITAAAGGLGNIATQLAIRAGNHVVGVVGDDAKAAWLESVGAARVVQHRREDLGAVLDGAYAERLDLALDSVGGATFDALLRNLAPLGRLVVCGYTSDRLPTERVRDERVYTRLYWKAASVRGFMNWRFAAHAAEARGRLLELLATGELRPLIDPQAFVGLEAAADAVEHLLAGRNLGKVVLDLRGGTA